MESQGFGKYLRLLRVNAGLTMVETSKLTGVTQGYISQIENEVHRPSARTLSKLAKAYGVSPLTLMKKAGIISEGHTRIPEASLRDLRVAQGLSRSELERMLRKALYSVNELTREVENLRRIEEVRQVQGGNGGSARLIRVPVVGPQLEPVVLSQAPDGMFFVPDGLLGVPEQGVVIQVSGEEMAPELTAGDLVLVERHRWPPEQGIVAVRLPQGVVFQQLSLLGDVWLLAARNPDYGHLNRLLPPGDGTCVLGQAVAVVARILF